MAVIGPFRKQYYVFSTYFSAQFRYQLPTNGLDAQFQNLEAALQAAKLNQRTRAANFVSMYGGDPRQAHRQGMSLGEDSVYQAMLGQMLFDMNAAKFLQNPALMTRLVGTHPDYLLNYNYWHDNRLGVCACGKCQHMGQNLLGVSLMAVRQAAMEISNQIDGVDEDRGPYLAVHHPESADLSRPIMVLPPPQVVDVTEPNDLPPDFAAPPTDAEIVGYYAVRGEDAIARASSQHTPPGPEFWEQVQQAGRAAGEAYVRLRDQINRDVLQNGVSALMDEATAGPDWYEDLPEQEQRDPSDRF